MASAAASLAIALFPAAVVLWRGRRLARMADDPALPERLASGRTVTSFVLACCMTLLVLAVPRHLFWSIPLLLVARMAAAYPHRRVLFQETWTLGTYLSFYVRLWIAFFGFWILVCAAPAIVWVTTDRTWVSAAAMAPVLLAWDAWYMVAIRWILRARPVDAALARRFDAIAARSEVRPAPAFYQIDVNGGVFVNAVALPSIRRPAVAFSETLLSRFESDELDAICGHELAHLEHFNPARLRRLRLTSFAIIAATLALAPMALYAAPSFVWLVVAAWPFLILIALAMRARRRQQHETASDLRAIALAGSGSGEALVRGLVKLHAMARVPRRWDAAFERSASHPSLARRIRAIRAAAGLTPAALEVPSVVGAASGGASVVFHADHIVWNEADGASHSLGYGLLSDLRVDARSGAAQLVAADRRGHRWSFSLANADVARTQAILDIVDARLSDAAGGDASSSGTNRVLIAAAALVSMLAGQFAILIAALFAFARPIPSLVAAVGVAAIAAAGITSRDAISPLQLGFAVALVVAGVPLVASAIRRRLDPEGAAAPREIGALAIAATLAWLVVFTIGGDMLHLHEAVRAFPATVTMSLALGAVLVWRPRGARVAASIAALIGLFAVCIGSTSFLDAFSGDPLLAAAPSLSTKTIAPRLVSQFNAPVAASGLRMSPAGRAVALYSEDDDENSTFHIGRPGGVLTAIDADDLILPDEDHALALVRTRNQAELQAFAVDAPGQALWRRALAGSVTHLSFDRSASLWIAVGRGAGFDVTRTIGRVDGSAISERRWALSGTASDALFPIAATARDVVLISTRYRRGLLGTSLLGAWGLGAAGGFRSMSRFIGLHDDGRTADLGTTTLTVNCYGAIRTDGAPVCSGFDGTRTHVAVIDPTARRIAPLGSLPGYFVPSMLGGAGWAIGYWKGGPVAMRLATGEVIRVANERGTRVAALAATDMVLGAVSTVDGGQSVVRLYSMQ